MRKNLIVLCLSMLCCCVLSGCQCEHQWTDATCSAPKSCTICEKTEGEALGHNWNAATCELPETCSRCQETRGIATDHSWTEATCTDPKTCTNCGTTKGDSLGHTEDIWSVVQEATAYQPGIREQKCTTCGEIIHNEEFYPDPVFYSNDFGMTTDEFVAIFNKVTAGDYELKPDGNDYVVHWLGCLDIGTSISFTENSNGLLTSISLDGRELTDNGNNQVQVCLALFRVLNPHLSEGDSIDEFKEAANSGGKEFIRGARYLYTELASLDVLWFTIQLD